MPACCLHHGLYCLNEEMAINTVCLCFILYTGFNGSRKDMNIAIYTLLSCLMLYS